MVIQGVISEYKHVFLSAVIVGLISFGWFLTNKIQNFDELYNLFAKGAELESGRWGLRIVTLFLPDVSLPWLWGIISLFFLAVSVCLIVNIAGINNRVLQCILSGVIVSFPSETATILYMFTFPCYAIAVFLSVVSVKLLLTGNRKSLGKVIFALLLQVVSISIYQAYVTVASSLFVIVLIVNLITADHVDKDYLKKCLQKGLTYLAFLALAMGAYYAITLLLQLLLSTCFNNYSLQGLNNPISFLERLRLTFSTFYRVFAEGIHGIVRSDFSAILHVACVLLGYFSGFFYCIHSNDDSTGTRLKVLLFVCFSFVILPMSISGLNLLLHPSTLHAVTMMSYSLIFVFSAKMIDLAVQSHRLPGAANVLSLLTVIIMAENVYYSNVIGLRQYIEYENAYSEYTAIAANIQALPNYKAENKIALAGVLPVSNNLDKFGLNEDNSVFGVSDFRNNYSRNELIQNYLGFDVEIASSHEVNMIRETEEYSEMPVYPNNGYIKIIGDYVVVKLSEESEGYYRFAGE